MQFVLLKFGGKSFNEGKKRWKETCICATVYTHDQFRLNVCSSIAQIIYCKLQLINQNSDNFEMLLLKKQSMLTLNNFFLFQKKCQNK